nr:histidine kinase [Auraticoccus cholistanensis]
MVEQQARAGERSRIARDMHDSLGHDLALIALQAGAWELTAGTPEQRAAAAAVRSAAVAATDRLHLVIGLLVGPDSPTGASTAQEEEPGAAGGTDVTALVERARRRGMAVELSWSRAEVAGAAAPWSAETARAAARVVQEGLTNAAKHAPGSQVVVRVEDADPVRVEVVSTGGSTPTASSGGGRGLIGLDERLRVLRGRLEAGRGDAGFHLVATMTRQARAAGPVDGDPAARQLVDLRRQGRRGRLRAALLPVSLALALATTLATAHAVTVAQTALAPADYERLRLGQPRVEVAALLPPRSQAQPPPLLVVPPAPAGASCSYYQARSSVLDLSSDMFRLCFGQLPGTADEPVLIAKDHLVAAVGGR